MSDQIARMIISRSVINMKRLGLYIFLLLGMAAITTTNREDECFYYFIQQPSSHVCCNPWPYIETYSGNALVLHCDLLSPQSNDINVEWYRIPCNDAGSKPWRIHDSGNENFSTSNSSGDISGGFKRINFTLFVNDVSEADAGCYWCEIKASAGKCSFPMKQSSVFCLHKKMAYGDGENCPILPVNSSVVCASNTVCDELPPNWMGDPYLITTMSDEPTQVPSPSQPMVPVHMPPAIQTNSAADVVMVSSVHYRSDSIFFHASQRPPMTSFTTHSIQPTISSNYHQHLSMTDEISLTPTSSSNSAFRLSSHFPRQNSPSADNYRTKVVPLSPSSSIHISRSADNKRETVVVSSSVVGLGSEMQSNNTMSNELPLHLTLVQISVFIGIAVCTVLFVVISLLVFGVVMLCRKSTPSTPARTYRMNHDGEGHHTFLNSPAELMSTVWRRELETSPVPTSVVNTEHALPPSSVPSYSSIRIAVTNEEGDQNPSHPDQPTTSPSLPLTSPMMSVPMTTLPSHMNTESRWRAYSLPLLSDRTGTINRRVNQLRHNQHRLSLEGNRESRLDYQQIDVTNTGSVSSPELHYYHVLERPEYYNCVWLEGEDGHELLLGQAKRSNRQRVTIKEDSDSESDSEYHWRVVLTTDQENGQDLDRNSSSKRVGRHLYRRLDHSTLEPLQDYAKVNIASANHDSDGSYTHSQ